MRRTLASAAGELVLVLVVLAFGLSVAPGAAAATSVAVSLDSVSVGDAIAFRNAQSTTGNLAKPSVTTPSDVATGDTLMMYLSINRNTTVVAPPGWTLVGSKADSVNDMQSKVWTRVADASDAGKAVNLTLGARSKFDLTVAAYTGVDPAAPIVTSAAASETVLRKAHSTPAVASAQNGDWVLSYWTDKTATSTDWIPPADQRVRAEVIGTGTGHVNALLTDNAGGGSGLTATSAATSKKAVMWTIVLNGESLTVNDTTAPIVTLVEPTDAAEVTGDLVMTGTAVDDTGATEAHLLIDGTAVAEAPVDISGLFSFRWDSTTASNGTHTIQLSASDAAGNTGVSSTATVAVQNAVDNITSGDVVSFGFDEGTAALSEPVNTAASVGTATVAAQVVSRDGGQALRADGRSAYALGLPPYSASTSEPRAVLRVVDDTGADSLSPDESDFSFGATARLDAVSQGTSTDNGNNLVQRGLFGDVAQYKVSLDARNPHCSVKGDQGRVSVSVDMVINAEDWYRLVCSRDDSSITLTVTQHHADGSTSEWVESNTGPIGAVSMASPTIPMSVGGKLNAQGAIVAATDQFNGVVDDVFLRITP